MLLLQESGQIEVDISNDRDSAACLRSVQKYLVRKNFQRGSPGASTNSETEVRSLDVSIQSLEEADSSSTDLDTTDYQSDQVASGDDCDLSDYNVDIGQELPDGESSSIM
ncbi:hypothetical protein THRCLA_21159 [Thraustotheca clavata]|uniref:Uncharacterized protein n=1 Tax=Thraustotheca clavata TaxID=74557 RepID=A0A1V9ZZM9_9STRA|nr:hypothetical protein THRCLA_21159 [Thraustotheca clavata]